MGVDEKGILVIIKVFSIQATLMQYNDLRSIQNPASSLFRP